MRYKRLPESCALRSPRRVPDERVVGVGQPEQGGLVVRVVGVVPFGGYQDRGLVTDRPEIVQEGVVDFNAVLGYVTVATHIEGDVVFDEQVVGGVQDLEKVLRVLMNGNRVESDGVFSEDFDVARNSGKQTCSNFGDGVISRRLQKASRAPLQSS